MDSFNLQIGIYQRICKFGGIYDVTSKFTLDATEYKVMIIPVHPTLYLKTYKMPQVISNPRKEAIVNTEYAKRLQHFTTNPLIQVKTF